MSDDVLFFFIPSVHDPHIITYHHITSQIIWIYIIVYIYIWSISDLYLIYLYLYLYLYLSIYIFLSISKSISISSSISISISLSLSIYMHTNDVCRWTWVCACACVKHPVYHRRWGAPSNPSADTSEATATPSWIASFNARQRAPTPRGRLMTACSRICCWYINSDNANSSS
jgi:hypothetical protein